MHDGAAAFASAFGAEEWGRIAGYWHDLGKYSDEFQNYLLGANGLRHPDNPGRVMPERADHKTFGVQLAAGRQPLGSLLAYVIAGHHGGLPDYADLDVLLKKKTTAPYAPATVCELDMPVFPKLNEGDESERGFQIAFWTRMLFSALVDADFLATESFMNAAKQRERTSISPPGLDSLRHALRERLDQFEQSTPRNKVNQARAEVLGACLERAEDSPGLFSLTVPTGGGKTLSSLAFALDHAVRHGLRRVIYAAPFTSIIEQNAEVFRHVLASAGPGAVLEHHCNFEPEKEDRWSRLASENWDAPLIVTTNVQLFESLFHHKPSRCRKLHRVAKSVIVLDEAQTIPVNLLAPTMAMLKELVRNYGCTVVLCTATQPALLYRNDFPIGLEGVREIVPDAPALYQTMRRVEVERRGTVGEEELGSALARESQVLCIVHTKPQARRVYRRLQSQVAKDLDAPLHRRGCLHLSADMCPAHRSLVIRLIRRRLRLGLPCRVVSTTLIEAGVDVDFPVVYRAMAGLDSIAQAAGRCNREGKRGRKGRVIVYETEEPPPVFARDGIREAGTIARTRDDLLAPETIEAYFQEHYWMHADRWDHGATDQSGRGGLPVMGCFAASSQFVFNFETASQRYRLIEDSQTPVVVPWGRRGAVLVRELESLDNYADRALRRRLQRFSVGVRKPALNDLLDTGAVVEAGDLARGVYFLRNEEAYDDALGLILETPLDPGALIV